MATRAMANDVEPRGIQLIDAPVSGGPRGGRRSAALPNFDYSAGLKALNIVSTPENLDRWLQSPMDWVPGTTMAFRGIEEARRPQGDYRVPREPGKVGA
jgi:hypothetical protein